METLRHYVTQKREDGPPDKERKNSMVKNAIRLPQPGEIKMIKDVATKVFAFVGIELKTFKEMPNGGVTVKARLTEAKRQVVVSGLFDFGIVLANIGNGEWGFAVRA
jgi:hypothetical protein